MGWLLGNHIFVKYSLFSVLLGYIRLLGTFVNGSYDIIIKIVQNCCRNLAVRLFTEILAVTVRW